MFSSFSRELSEDEYSELVEVLRGNQLPTLQVGDRAMKGTGFNSFTLSYERDEEEESYSVKLIPKNPSTTVDMNNPKKVDADVVITNRTRGKSWYLDSEKAMSLDFIPELKQSFYEGDSYREREADFKYHFSDGSTEIAKSSSNPVQRLEEPVTVTNMEFLGGKFPQRWLMETDDGRVLYLRERSGSIRLIDEAGNGELLFKAYVGGEHPGTMLYKHEVVNIVTSVDYINIENDYEDEVSEEAMEEYWNDDCEFSHN